MADQNKKSIFFTISNALKGNKKDIVDDLDKTRGVLTSNNPFATTGSNTVQDKQQQFMDVQSLKLAQDLYSRSIYYDADRISAYNDYKAMDITPEINAALDIMSDECVTRNDRGEILSIYSENTRIKKILKNLFENTLNIDYNLWFWTRELLKNGDNFLKLEIDQKLGIYDIVQLPTGEIHKEVGFDGNPKSVRYKWDVPNMYFVDFQIAHFSLISDGTRLPYGRSVLESARKLWKQLQLAEDAMLVYRLVRAPERRIFYIEVGNMDPGDIKQYIGKMKEELKKSPVVDKQGNVNLKYNPITHEEDYFLPIRGDKSSRIETLPGACLALNTQIHLLDGRTLSLNQIIEEFEKGEKLDVYSINPDTGEVVPGPITWAGITRKNTNVVKITLDNDKTIIVTPDHKFPTRHNGIQQAQNLKPGDSLWSFNKKFKSVGKQNNKKNNEYEMIFDHSKNKWIFTHRMVANFYNKFNAIEKLIFDIQYKDELKQTVHHINFNRFDNSPNNLALVNNKDHYQYHQKLILEYSEIGWKTWLNKYNTDNEFKSKVLAHLEQARSQYYKNRTDEQIKNHNSSISSGLKKYFEGLSEEELIKEMEPLFKNSEKARENLNKKLNDENFKKSVYKKVSQKSKITKNKTENLAKYRKNSKKLWLDNNFRISVIEPQTIKYSNILFDIVKDLLLSGKNSKQILEIINEKNSAFYLEFHLLNSKNNQLKKMTEFTHNNLVKLVKHFGYSNWMDFTKTAEFYNHKVISVEFLTEKIDTGTITVDGNEAFHNYHNFALEAGVFTQNSNLGDIADIEYLQNKLFAAIKVPKTYLNYSEALPGGSTLSQADLRFSRTITRFQEAVVRELRRIANIHLYILGFVDDLDNFKLSLTNPSTQQELLKLETMKARLDVFKEMFSSDATSPVSYTWAMEYILHFSKSEIYQILRQKKIERKMFNEIDRAHEEYMDTGIFTKLDRKFRKPGFDPNTALDSEEGEGGDSGGDGGFGGGSSLGGGMDLGGGLGGDMGGDMGGGDTGMPDLTDDSSTGGPEDTGAEKEEEEPTEDNLQEGNKLLKENKQFNYHTKRLLNNINEHLKRISDNNLDKL